MNKVQYIIRQFSYSVLFSGSVMPYLSNLLVYSANPRNRWTISPSSEGPSDSGL